MTGANRKVSIRDVGSSPKKFVAAKKDHMSPYAHVEKQRKHSMGVDRKEAHVLVLSETKARGKGRVLEGFERLATPPRRRPALKPKRARVRSRTRSRAGAGYFTGS